MMAALYDEWKPPNGGDPLYTYTVLTVDASPELDWLHDRMPVLLNADGVRKWLDVENYSFDDVAPLLRAFRGPLRWHAVSDLVGNVKNDGAQLIAPREEQRAASIAKGLGRFFTVTKRDSPEKGASPRPTDGASPPKRPRPE